MENSATNIEQESISNGPSCPYHPKVDLFEDHRAGDMICGECGLVVADRIVDVGSEWRSFSDEQGMKDGSRVGGPEDLLLPGGGLGTFLSVNFDASESSKNLAKTFKKRVANSVEGALRKARPLIYEMAERIYLPSEIQFEALQIFKEVLEKKKSMSEAENSNKGKEFVGNEIETQAVISLTIACKRRNITRTFKEMSACSGVSLDKIHRYYGRMNEILKGNGKELEEKPTTSSEAMTTPSTNWFTSLIPRFCGLLEIQRLEFCVGQIAERASKMSQVAGRKPSSIAAASIYLACKASNIKRSAKEIGEISGTSENTVKLIYKILLLRARELFPKNFTFAVPIEYLSKS